jgi:hypothetical protein
MPKALHRKLARKAAEKGLTGERRDAYVYGTLYKAEHGGKGKGKSKKRR